MKHGLRLQMSLETLIRDVGNNFQRFTITFKVTRSGILKPRFAIIASDTGGFSVAGYQLETGTVATDWTPLLKISTRKSQSTSGPPRNLALSYPVKSNWQMARLLKLRATLNRRLMQSRQDWKV